MLKNILFIFILLLFSGCVNKKGLTLKYYDECHTEYGYYGDYDTKCPYNFYNFKEKKKKDCLQCN